MPVKALVEVKTQSSSPTKKAIVEIKKQPQMKVISKTPGTTTLIMEYYKSLVEKELILIIYQKILKKYLI